MAIYREDLDISAEQWRELLCDSSVFEVTDLDLMKALYACEGCREKASVLANVLGVSHYSVLNLQIGRLGKRIINKIPDVKFPADKDGNISYWHIPFWAEDAEKKGRYFWELRPELKEAIEKLSNADKINMQVNNAFTPEIRIIPMNKSIEFKNKPFEVVQQEFFLDELINGNNFLYLFRNAGINCAQNALLLFQYDNSIIACARLKGITRYENPKEGIYKGALALDKKSIRVFDPITTDELHSLDPDFKKFSQVKQSLNIDCLPRLLALISSKEGVRIAAEIPEETGDLVEGAKKRITVNAYERNPIARRRCLQEYGYKCCVCGFSFEEVYGEIGTGYIEVHHLKPLNEINKEYRVDPINDLRPVCPNCHSMLHKVNLTVEQLRGTLRKGT